ncbi:MAG: endonuclease domain-containing protein [Desulfuromusa sp.]|nr:endonuclease domain-containing protein [Desulfuromusa sp.]
MKFTATARELRKASTDAEHRLWHHLRAKQLEGLKFRRQEQIGRFIVDFVCYEKSLVIEADSGQHAVELEKDEERTLWLNSQGFHVLRFWNHEILTNTDGVMDVIRRHCCGSPLSPTLSPTLSHQGEREKN